MEFSGTPKKYLQISVFGSIALNLYLYLGLAGVLYWYSGVTWMFGWKPILITVIVTVLFARSSYRWMMRLDAQYGTGRGGQMISRPTKLPERVTKR